MTADGIAYLLGNTTSQDLDTTPGAFQENFQGGATDYFVARVDLSADRSCDERVLYLSYLGSSVNDDTPGVPTNTGLAADSSGIVTISGYTMGGLQYPHTVAFGSPSAGAAAGVMFRESTAADGRFAAVQLRNLASRRVDFYYRDDQGRARSVRGPAVEQLPVSARLEHRRATGPTGETLEEFVGYARVGGEDWAEVGRVQIAAVSEEDRLLAGIAATAGIATTATTFQALQATACDLSLTSEPCSPPSGPAFRRADANSDAAVDISDAVFALNWLFLGGTKPDCIAALNANGDGTADISDAVYLLGHLFLGGPAPAAPFPGCGASALAADADLGCETPPAGCR